MKTISRFRKFTLGVSRFTLHATFRSSLLAILACTVAVSCAHRAPVAAGPKKVLVVSVTTGFRHSSIAIAEKTLAQLGLESGAFTVVDYAQQPSIKVPQKPNAPQKPKAPATDAGEAAQLKYTTDLAKFETADTKYKADLEKWNASAGEVKAAQASYDQALKDSLAKLSPENLKKYDAVIFANTTGVLPLPDKQGFLNWIKEGHAFIGMHSASDTFHDPKGGIDPYIEMLGGEFQTHGAQEVVECLNKDLNHPATKHFGNSFDIGGKREEMYIIKSYDPKTVHELLVLDKHPNTKAPGHYAVSWCKEYGKGKVFYTSLGHNEYVWQMPTYQQHIAGGIKWALGLEKGDATPQAK
jgi:type 1 glutamine amidotransferase